MLAKLTTYKGSVPQGAPTSPAIANLVFKDTMSKLTACIEKYEIVFTSYLDDLSFSSSKCFKEIIAEILTILRKNGFILIKKNHYHLNTCEITGLILSNRKSLLKSEMRIKVKTNPHIMVYKNYVASFNYSLASNN